MLKEQLEEYKLHSKLKVSVDSATKMAQATALLQNEKFIAQIAKAGDKIPNSELLDHNGNSVKLYDYLDGKATIINFYRGTWCPYCNFELKEYAKLLNESGINMIAISPEKPDIAENKLSFDSLPFSVLSDKDNSFAKKLNLTFQMPDYLNDVYLSFGINVDKSQGNENRELPVPVTYVIDKDGIITKSWIDVDYTTRAEPSEVVDFYKSIN